MFCLDFKHGPLTPHRRSDLVIPQFVVCTAVIKVSRMAMLRALSVATECYLTIAAAEDLDNPTGEGLNVHTGDGAMEVRLEDGPT